MPLSDQVVDYFLQLPDSELEDATAIRVTIGDEVFDFEITEEMLGQRERWKDAYRELRQARLDAGLAKQEFVRQTLPLLCMLVAIWPIKPGAVDPVTGTRTCDEGEACCVVNRDGECPDFSPKLPAQLPMIVFGAVACSVAVAVLVLAGLGVLP